MPRHDAPPRWAPAASAVLVVFHVAFRLGAGSVPAAALPSAASALRPLGTEEAAAIAAACDDEIRAAGAPDDVASVSLLQRSVRLRSGAPLAGASSPQRAGDVAGDDAAALSLLQRSMRLRGGGSSLASAGWAPTALNSSAPSEAVPPWTPGALYFWLQGQEVLIQGAKDWWHQDVFQTLRTSLQPDEYLYTSAPGDEWLVLAGTVAACLSINYFVFQFLSGSWKMNILVVVFWIATGASYNAYFANRYGRKEGEEWCVGYLLEWILSIDNMFVFLVVFKTYHTPERLMRKALVMGIVGGMVMRAGTFVALGTLLRMIHWARMVFGMLLIYSGMQAVADEGEDDSLESKLVVRMAGRILGTRLLRTYDAQGTLFPVDRDGKHCVSLLMIVILCLEAADAVFALDSASAKVAEIPSQYIAYGSSVIAMFGIRATFFVIKDMIDHFELLRYGLCIILVFTGAELVASPVLHLDSATLCAAVLAVLTVSATASTAKSILQGKGRFGCGTPPFSASRNWSGPRGPGAHDAG